MDYLVINCPIKFNKKVYKIGEIIELDENIAGIFPENLEKMNNLEVDKLTDNEIIDTIEFLTTKQLIQLANEQTIDISGCKTKGLIVDRIKQALFETAIPFDGVEQSSNQEARDESTGENING